MLQFRNKAAALFLCLILSAAAASCGSGSVTCAGSLHKPDVTVPVESQYGNVTCITQSLDKEVTDGGE